MRKVCTWAIIDEKIKLIEESVVGVDEINLIGYILNVLIDANEHI